MGTKPSTVSVRHTASNVITITYDGAAAITERISKFVTEKNLGVVPISLPANPNVTRLALLSDDKFTRAVVHELTARLNARPETPLRQPQPEAHAAMAL